VWFWAQATYNNPAWKWTCPQQDRQPGHVGDLNRGYWWPPDEDMTWTVLEGDFDEEPAPEQYYRHEEYHQPPWPVYPQASWFQERWKGKKTFTTTGHYQFLVEVSYDNGPPHDPVDFTYDVYVVEAHVEEVAFYRQPLDPETGEPATSVQMRKRGDWTDDLYGDECTGSGTSTFSAPQWVHGSPSTSRPLCYPKDYDVPGNGQAPVRLVLMVTVVFTNAQQQYGDYMPFELSGESADPLDPGEKLHFVMLPKNWTGG